MYDFLQLMLTTRLTWKNPDYQCQYRYTSSLLTMTASSPAAQAMGDSLPNNPTKSCRKRHDRPSCPHGVDSLSTGTRQNKGVVAKRGNCSVFYYLLSTYIPKLILEVMGGAGAIWGFSEACGLRRPETVYFWRPAALVVGALFFLRFLKEIYVDLAAQSQRSSLLLPASSSSCDLELGKNDLELTSTESTTIDSPSSNHETMTPSDGRPQSSPTEMTALKSNPNAPMPKALFVPSLGHGDSVA